MKLFDPKTGGHRFRLDDLKLLQTAYYDGFKAFASFLDPSLNVILSGAIVTDDTVTVTCTGGYAAWQGEVFEVIPNSFTLIVGQQLYFKLVEDVLPPSPVQYNDLTSHDVHINRRLELNYYNSGDAGEYYSNFSRADALGVRKGTVLDWFGNVNTEFDTTGMGINSMNGYHICNGVLNTPDLRGVFVVSSTNVPSVGAPVLNAALGVYSLGDTGGTKTVVLSKANLPNYNLSVIDPGHKHLTASGWSIYGTNDGAGSSLSNSGSDAVDFDTKTNDGLALATTGIQVASGGGDTPHENCPPFFALIKIIKL